MQIVRAFAWSGKSSYRITLFSGVFTVQVFYFTIALKHLHNYFYMQTKACCC